VRHLIVSKLAVVALDLIYIGLWYCISFEKQQLAAGLKRSIESVSVDGLVFLRAVKTLN